VLIVAIAIASIVCGWEAVAEQTELFRRPVAAGKRSSRMRTVNLSLHRMRLMGRYPSGFT